MREAVHIFLKDSRHLRIPIAIVLMWTGLFLVAGATDTRSFFGRVDGWRDALGYLVPTISNYVLPIGWWFLVSRAFHAEAIPGDRQFWLTRPYRRSSLFGAKALFVLAYITVPLAVAQLVIVVVRGFPVGPSMAGMLWSQLLILSVIVLPAAALATLTSNLTQFVVVGLAAPLVFAAHDLLTPWGPFGWIRINIAVGLVMAVSSTVLYVQFSRRRTGTSRLIALAGILALVVTLAFLPWRTAFALQSRVNADWTGPLTAELVTAQPDERRKLVNMGTVAFRIVGLPARTPITCEATEATFQGEGGIWNTGFEAARGRRLSESEDGCTLLVNDAILSRVGTGPVSIHAVFYITAFGAELPTAVPINQQPTALPNSVVCVGDTRRELIRVRSEIVDNSMTSVGCLSAFRDPRGLTLFSSLHGSDIGLSRLSYSPFPADLRIAPIGAVAGFSSRPADVVTLSIREPISHAKIVVDVRGVHLRDFLR